jgi:capsular polysaccharide transport system permease protein
MINLLRKRQIGRPVVALHDLIMPRLLRRTAFQGAMVAILLAVIYWGAIASARYVSEARVIVDRTDLAGGQGMDFTTLITGGRSSQDLLLLRDYLRSVDLLQRLDAKVGLRAHYSDRGRDPLSRMWFSDASQEFFHRHYLSRVGIELDAQSGVLRIRAQAYSPEMAQAIASFLVEEGERFMNDMAHRLGREQVEFLEKQVAQMSERLIATRQTVVDFQNAKGLLSPKDTAVSLATIVAHLEGRLSELNARRGAMLGYLSPDAPDVAQLGLEIGAVENQLRAEQARLAAPGGGTLNRTVEEYQRLEMAAVFAQDVYRTALVALEKGRVEATRTLKKVSVLQNPTLPQYPLEPRRIYNIVVFALSALVLSGILHLLAAIIRDHKD